MIRLENISKTFNTKDADVHAVRDVTLEIQDGEIFGIIGFSGAGKSTLVRCINLLERPTKGRVFVNGAELTSLNEKELRNERKKIGMIFQHFNLMSQRTVYQNIAYPLKGSKLSKEEQEQKILSLLELIDLKDKKDAYPSQLSGGQKQRVAIARALANDPKVLLCDEATSALDPISTARIEELVNTLKNKYTVIMVTHNMQQAQRIADNTAFFYMGEMVECADTHTLFNNPEKKQTIRYVSGDFG